MISTNFFYSTQDSIWRLQEVKIFHEIWFIIQKIYIKVMRSMTRKTFVIASISINELTTVWMSMYDSMMDISSMKYLFQLSPFGYNQSIAQEFYPLGQKEAEKIGANWTHYQADFPKAEKIISAEKIPDNISNIPDDILNWAIECEITKKPFRIIKQELDFYRKHNLWVPKRHPNQRYIDRLKLRTPLKSYERSCDNCKSSIISSYNPARPENIYCQSCYNKEIY